MEEFAKHLAFFGIGEVEGDHITVLFSPDFAVI